MKIILAISALFLLSSCELPLGEGPNGPNSHSGSAQFLISKRSGSNPGLYVFEYSGGNMNSTFVSSVAPKAYSIDYMDYQNGNIAMASVDEKLLYGNTSNYSFKEVPDIGAEPGFWYNKDVKSRPQILSDGRVVYHTTLETDNLYDDNHRGQYAIYDPSTDKTVVTGDLTEWVLAQPEKEADTQVGTASSGFILSEDERYIYFKAIGYGTEAGSIHIDYSILTRFDLQNGGYERLAHTDFEPIATSSNGNDLFVYHHPDFGVFDISDLNNIQGIVEELGSVTTGNLGQISGNEILVNHRADFLGLVSRNDGLNRIITESTTENMSYRGVGYGTQISGDDIYFTLSNDFHTNYDNGFDVYKVNKNNPSEIDSLFRVDEDFMINLFVLLD